MNTQNEAQARRIVIGSDHAGYALKEDIRQYLATQGFDVADYGTYSDAAVDYPDYASAVARAVLSGGFECGLLICGTGLGMSITANKFSGIRCACCSDTYSARLARTHNDANILAMGARVIGSGIARDIVDAYLGAQFEPRHQPRLDKIADIERQQKCEKKRENGRAGE